MKLCWCTDTVIFMVCALLVVIHCIIRLKFAWRGCSHSSTTNTQVLSRIRLVCDTLRAALQSFVNPSKSGLDKLVQDKLELRRAAAAGSSYVILANGISVALALIVWNIARENPRWATTWQTIIAIILQATGLVASCMPALNARMREIIYAVLMILLAIFVRSSSPDYHLFSSATALLIRILLSFLHMNVSSAVIWNMVIVSASCSLGPQSRQSNIPPEMLYIWEVGSTAILLFAVVEIRRWTLTVIRQDIDVSNLMTENQASVSLLDMVCDVTVELTSNLGMARDSRAFAALLMISSGKSLDGIPFCNFISGEDEKDNFRGKLLAADAGVDVPVGTCRVSLSDSMRNHVNVEIFFVKIYRQDGDRRFLLGIREFSDTIHEMRSFQPQPRKRAEASTNKGTPPDSEHVILETKELPRTLGSSKRHWNLRFPHLACTQLDAMCSEIVWTMGSWNIDHRMTFCCTFHAYVSQLKEVYGMLSRTQCGGFPFQAPHGFQCQTCGLFDDKRECEGEERDCHYCRSCKFKFFEAPKESISL